MSDQAPSKGKCIVKPGPESNEIDIYRDGVHIVRITTVSPETIHVDYWDPRRPSKHITCTYTGLIQQVISIAEENP
jgi:hypothetical protein